MSVLAIGISHRTADLRMLERAAVPTVDVDKVLSELLGREHVSEAMLISTCNRIEVYAAVEAFHGGLSDLSEVLARHAGVEPAKLYEHLYVHYNAAAVEHLFSVTAGLDSMVVGETQILGQVRAAYGAADDAGTLGSTLHELVQTALRVGKRVHSETGLDRLGASVVSEALVEAEAVLGELAGRHALIIGAGSMGGLVAAHLRRAGIGSVTVANRTEANGARLADSLAEHGVAARAIGLDRLGTELTGAEIVLCCTGATGVVLRVDDVAARRGGPLLICDLGLPRDVESGVAELAEVSLVDLATLQRRQRERGTVPDTELAKEIVAGEVRSYLAGQRSAAVTPTVTALRKRAAEVVDTELLRLDSRLPELDDGVRDELTRTVRRVVDKLLHTPTVRVKQLASESGGAEYADALRELFGLDPQAPNAISAPKTTPKSEQSELDGDDE
ncbi:MAG: glutamyl-tRNA reductase [Pseudonocardiaceae bacterium]|nr:glutamyl-tRNA reductase [Pseudonocardiaceae bacterium]